MRISVKSMAAMTGVVACLAASALVSAQVERTTQKPASQAQQGERFQQGQQSQAQGADAKIATWIALGDFEEITLSHQAINRASNEQVREFGQKMVDDHTKSLEKLRELGAQVAVPPAVRENSGQGARDQSSAQRQNDQNQQNLQANQADQPRQQNAGQSPRQNQGTQQTAATRQGMGGDLDFLSIHREITEECLKAALADLESKSGVEFDKCYMNGQVAAHMKQLETVKVMSKHAQSQELKDALQEEQQSIKQHLEEARQIAKSLDRVPRTAENP